MGISDRLLGKKNVNGNPHIEAVHPGAALPGGEVRIVGKSLRPHELRRPQVRFGEVEGAVVISSDDFLVARVPPGASSGPVVVSTNGTASNPHQVKVAVADRRESASGYKSSARQRRKHLRHFLRIARPESSGCDLQNRHQLQRETIPGGDDECNVDRLRSRRADVRVFAL